MTTKTIACAAVALAAVAANPPVMAAETAAPNGLAPTLEDVAWMTCGEVWTRTGGSHERVLGLVRQMADYSASRRGIDFPNTREAGAHLGRLIRERCARQRDELLLSIVDRSVRDVVARR